jgi:hypothetical protein
VNDCDHCIHHIPTVYERRGCDVAEMAYYLMERDMICKLFKRREIDEQQTSSESSGEED